jgi:uncharacterized protein (TIGR03083 family)
MVAVDVATIEAVRQPEAATLAAVETARFAAALRDLDDAEWSAPTACPLWDVRAMAGHVLGMTETFSGLRPFARDMRAGQKRAGDGPMVDGLTAQQVDLHAGLSRDELIAELERLGPVQARWRGSRRIMRRIPLSQPMADGTVEKWKAGYLFDIILTRDTWMHRSDLAEATGRPMALTAEHDGRLVADVVAEWARRHGQPFTLELTGPAGGSFEQGTGGEALSVDAVDFCRILSGRGSGVGLLATEVPF